MPSRPSNVITVGVDAGSGADLSPSLTGEGHDGSEDGRGRKAFALTERTRADGRNLETQDDLAYALTNPGSGGRPHSRLVGIGWVNELTHGETQRRRIYGSDGLAPNLQAEDGRGHGVPAVVSFTQNTRDEVRLIGGDGDIAGALGAEEGMHQRNYVATGAVRRLTPTECERLQGFPDGWTDGQPDSARYRQLGNAVAVPVVRWIAARIAEVAR